MNDNDLNNYELLDFGAGRKLERFAGLIVDRPAPAVLQVSKRNLRTWEAADLVFDGAAMGQGNWHCKPGIEIGNWELDAGFARFTLDPRPAGQIGIFPEQQINWQWILERKNLLNEKTVLNLFAYTGGTTLAAAAVGAQVVHVDSAKNIVGVARENAKRSGLAEKPIRWIVDDATKFVERERRRGRKYSAIFLDPPSYGHGANNERWKIDRDLPPLLETIRQLLDDRFALSLTCHTVGFDEEHLVELVRSAGLQASKSMSVETGPLTLVDQSGRELPSGCYLSCMNF